ncbi:MAG: OmpA family protein [Bacteroidetes bacterium]|nr:OmpA family protein [Bacteroidota bacterium]
MKKHLAVALLAVIYSSLPAQINNPKQAAKNAAENKVNSNVNTGVNNAADKTENAIKGLFKKKNKTETVAVPNTAGIKDTTTPADVLPKQNDGAFKTYNNYDFVPGNKIIFEDDFRDDLDGEFASHWSLESGQGVVNTLDNERLFAITKYYSKYTPYIKTKTYLPAQYTIEFDTWLDAGYDSNEGVYIEFRKGKEVIGGLYTNHDYYRFEFGNNKLQGDLPMAIKREAYHNKWHHIAIAIKDKQVKIYCDQYRVVVIPDCNFTATNIAVGGNASEGMTMLFKNFRLAEGGNMNVTGKKFTDAKIVTHGITFDYNKATIKPESMGTLNMITQIMKDNPDIKFEVGGHTDSDGDDAYNIKLSQQRADAVKAQLIKMGIDATRLTTKGYGEAKPVADNSTSEGKANNRRVEFLKL